MVAVVNLLRKGNTCDPSSPVMAFAWPWNIITFCAPQIYLRTPQGDPEPQVENYKVKPFWFE